MIRAVKPRGQPRVTVRSIEPHARWQFMMMDMSGMPMMWGMWLLWLLVVVLVVLASAMAIKYLRS